MVAKREKDQLKAEGLFKSQKWKRANKTLKVAKNKTSKRQAKISN